MDNRYEIAEQNGMSREFADWFFDNKKADCGDVWFMMMAAMWEGWKGRAAMPQVADGTLTNEGTMPIDMLTAALRNAPLAPSDNQGRKAEPVLVVPEEIKHRIGGLDWGWEGEFNRGWNACRAEFLKNCASVKSSTDAGCVTNTRSNCATVKDHQIRELVNELRDIAVEYYGTQQLRERIARTVRAAMFAPRGEAAPMLDSESKNTDSRPRGNEPVSQPYKLSFDQWMSQQEGYIDVECGCVMTEVLFHWMRVAYEAGNCRENEDSSTKNFRELSETSTKCWCHTCRPVTISDMRFVVCPECGNKRCPKANDHRHSCTGSNEPGQEGSAYPAAPQQENKCE